MAGHGYHWPNILRFNPKRNPESVALWIEFYNREAEKFGTMISRDIAFATAQGFYHYFAKTEETKSGYRFDLAEARALMGGRKAPLYLSVQNGRTPKAREGVTVSLYEEKQNFKTYEIASEADIFEIEF
jgi:hypothetical protein